MTILDGRWTDADHFKEGGGSLRKKNYGSDCALFTWYPCRSHFHTDLGSRQGRHLGEWAADLDIYFPGTGDPPFPGQASALALQ